MSDFVNLGVNARFRSGIRLAGGIDTGRTITDQCFVIDSPQQLKYCRLVIPLSANLQVKLNGSIPFPGNITLSGIYQNTAGPQIEANYPAPTALIAPSLGRNLAGGTRTATAPLMQPYTQFEPAPLAARPAVNESLQGGFESHTGSEFRRVQCA